jgi:hypothetical protein
MLGPGVLFVLACWVSRQQQLVSTHPTPAPGPPLTHLCPQIDVPDTAKNPRIINCAAATVDCANTALYGPCCEANRRRGQRKASRRA